MSINNKKQALGKGIRALLNTIDDEMKSPDGAPVPPAVSGQAAGNIARIPIEQIVVNPKQPRPDYDRGEERRHEYHRDESKDRTHQAEK